MTTQTQLDNLKNIKNSGVSRTEYDGKKVEYRSLNELQQIEQSMQDELSAASAPRSLTRKASFARG